MKKCKFRYVKPKAEKGPYNEGLMMVNETIDLPGRI